MNERIKEIQDKIMNNLKRLDNASIGEDLSEEVSRSNAVSQLANTYIKTCNLIIRVEETKSNIKNKINNGMDDEK